MVLGEKMTNFGEKLISGDQNQITITGGRAKRGKNFDQTQKYGEAGE